MTLLALTNGMPDFMIANSTISEASDFDLVMGDVFGAATFVLTVVPEAVRLCSSVAISVKPKTILLFSLSNIGVIDLIFVVNCDDALRIREALASLPFCFYACLVILMGKHLGLA